MVSWKDLEGLEWNSGNCTLLEIWEIRTIERYIYMFNDFGKLRKHSRENQSFSLFAIDSEGEGIKEAQHSTTFRLRRT